MTGFLMTLMFIVAVFLILLVLVQRGRGGGLAGAFGGMGGQSAFGAKAGDTFTKVTIGVATFWILLCVFTLKNADQSENRLGSDLGTESKPTAGASLRPEANPAPEENAGEGENSSGNGQGASEGAAGGASGDTKPASSDESSGSP